MVEGWRPRSWAQLGQQQRSRSGFSTLDSARATGAFSLEPAAASPFHQWLDFPRRNPISSWSGYLKLSCIPGVDGE